RARRRQRITLIEYPAPPAVLAPPYGSKIALLAWERPAAGVDRRRAVARGEAGGRRPFHRFGRILAVLEPGLRVDRLWHEHRRLRCGKFAKRAPLALGLRRRVERALRLHGRLRRGRLEEQRRQHQICAS